MNGPATAPWTLAGTSLTALARWRGPGPDLPSPLHPLPGPAVVAALNVTESPVGPYRQLMIGVPARLGVRPGWYLAVAVVDSAAAESGARLNWGFPARPATLRWIQDGRRTEVAWVERDLTIRATAHGPPLPTMVPLRFLGRRGDGPVVVPGRVRGLGRLARCTVGALPGDELAALGGRHPALAVGSLRFLLRPARAPVGRASTLVAPLRAPEPALWFGERPAAIGE